jgi:hypothetical protein
MDKELDAFLYDVQWKAHNLIGVCMVGNTEKGKVLAAELCGMVADYRNAHKMEHERTHENAFDLSALSVDLDREHPELEEDEDADNPFRGE